MKKLMQFVTLLVISIFNCAIADGIDSTGTQFTNQFLSYFISNTAFGIYALIVIFGMIGWLFQKIQWDWFLRLAITMAVVISVAGGARLFS